MQKEQEKEKVYAMLGIYFFRKSNWGWKKKIFHESKLNNDQEHFIPYSQNHFTVTFLPCKLQVSVCSSHATIYYRESVQETI